MAFYVYRPPACPACDTRDLIERTYAPAPGMHLVSYHCPRCQWMVEGKDPAYIGRTGGRLLRRAYLDGDVVWDEIDEPMRRYRNQEWGSVERVPLDERREPRLS